jgi:hypothetical protein
MSILGSLKEAVDSSGLSHQVVAAPPDLAESIIRSTQSTFAEPNSEAWWWESLASTIPCFRRVMKASDHALLSAICPDGPAWLIAHEDDQPWPVFSGSAALFSKIISNHHYFEYTIVADDFSWFVTENHHNFLLVAGDAAAHV